jgi:hypothetical protein
LFRALETHSGAVPIVSRYIGVHFEDIREFSLSQKGKLGGATLVLGVRKYYFLFLSSLDLLSTKTVRPRPCLLTLEGRSHGDRGKTKEWSINKDIVLNAVLDFAEASQRFQTRETEGSQNGGLRAEEPPQAATRKLRACKE